jgi:hypothetical protein
MDKGKGYLDEKRITNYAENYIKNLERKSKNPKDKLIKNIEELHLHRSSMNQSS